MNLLMFACKKTNSQTVQVFLEYPHLQAYHRDQNGRNIIHYAIENNDNDEAEIIIK